MRLPAMKYSDGYRDSVQTVFGGYDHRAAAGNGQICDMGNLTGDEYPLMAARQKRGLVRTLTSPQGIGVHGKLCWAAGGRFWYDNVDRGEVSTGEKTFLGMGNRILIWPDKKVYYTDSGTMEALESSVSGTGVGFKKGEIYGEEAEANSVYCANIDFRNYFAPGDGVTIEGCTKHKENNKTPILREISEDGHTLRFSEYAFVLDGGEGTTDYTESGTITFRRWIPEMDYICVNENRLWGCKGDTVYASKLGDPRNFNVFDGVGTDSFSVPAGSGGDFTGCVSYGGYPIFFKERAIYKMYGDLPTNFQLMGGPELGVKAGCHRSLAAAGNTLFYLSPAGMMAYAGGVPSPVGENLGDTFTEAVGGSDGLKYYVSMRDSSQKQHLFVIDTRRGLWYREDESEVMGFAAQGAALYMLKRDGGLWDLSGATGTKETAVSWYAEFADFDEASPNAKSSDRLQLRLEPEAGTTVTVKLMYDSSGEWITVKTMTAAEKHSVVLPIIPRRADHYRLRLEGTGGCRVYSLSRRIRAGSERKTK